MSFANCWVQGSDDVLLQIAVGQETFEAFSNKKKNVKFKTCCDKALLLNSYLLVVDSRI